MITYEFLKEILHYDPITGLFTWKVDRSGAVKIGSIAGGPHNKGYWNIRVGDKKYLAHRLAWFWMTGEWPEEQIDHKDCNRRNNTWVNLREATRSQNAKNTTKYKNNKSGFKGVCFSKQSENYIAQIQLNGRTKFLGHFNTAEEAAEAYKIAVTWYHREFGRT